ncbi:enhanced level of genomic instability 1 isoform X1 [Colletes latitarsis]|uniref:enhanced level of genomic instability 1 isoform X1 n=2 Tax=Colletes latitarsis TaxID=2605962 RepID=UPI00403624B3
MKNITQYLMDAVKSSKSTVHSNDNTKKETNSTKGSKGKCNHVKVKISRTDTKDGVCDILKSNTDMIDETLNSFTKVYNVDKKAHKPKSSSSLKLTSQKLRNQDLDYLSLETKTILVNKLKHHREKQNSQNCLDSDKNYKKELRSEQNINIDINSTSTFKNKNHANNIDLLIIDSSDNDECYHKESNAFQIIMSRNNKSIQQTPQIRVLSQNKEIDAGNSEEYKEKLKRSKEKLIALADKKGYSKRKLFELEESEKVERIIQNRIKAFKKEEKKDNVRSTVLSQRQPQGNLLNYFRKTPVDLTHTNISDMSTIVVKADVHIAENSIKHGIHNSDLSNEIRPNRKNRSDLDLPQIDDINIIGSENISTSHKKKEHDQQQQNNKCRWSLRVKFRNYEDKNSILGNSSDEELFSPKSKDKLNMENSKKSKRIKNICSEDLSLNIKSKRSMPKRMNECVKVKLKELKQSECSTDGIVIQDNKNSKTTFKNEHKVTSCKHKSIFIQDKNEINYVCTNLENINEVKLSKINSLIHDNNSKRKTTDKLAPLFTKRQKPDPEIVAARQLFLQPDITDRNNKTIDRKVNGYGTLPFPGISHITQLSNLNSDGMINFHIRDKILNQYVPVLNVNNYKFIIDFSETKLKPSTNIKKPKIQEVLSEMEQNCPDVRKMWDIVLFAIKENSNKTMSPKTKTRRSKQLEKKQILECKSKGNQIEDCSWTYKYRPKNAKEVIGNEEAAAKLKEWLIGWTETFTNKDDSSGDEFYLSDNSSSRISENNQVAVLLGPHGSGKTATVYAVAEEFGYTVLEVNASSRRTGKKLLKELEEATKSHRIKKKNSASAFFNSISNEMLPKEIPQNSLILIEDIDLVFEEDEGFTSATYQLASNTKRPIVMTCRDVYPQLSKIAPQQNRIYFQNVVGSRMFALLELISLAETGYKLPHNCITELVQTGDLRKAILQLQYLLLSGPVQIPEQCIIFKNSFWQNMHHYLYKPAIKISKRQRTKKIADGKVTNDNKEILNDVASKLDNIVLLSSLINIEDTALNLWQIKTQPSLSLIEDTASYSVSNNICLNIAEWISNKVTYKDHLNKHDETQYQNNIILKKQLNNGINIALSHTASLVLDRRIISTDYLPSVRTICRAEECKVKMNLKRGNRFFHYLHSLKVPSTSFQPNILSAACQVMYDKIDNDTRIIKSSN